ncbi:MAG: EamA family transporter [Planctomycetes bacterium]|nr:EamA family transporter [Planctomycetota bacterium]
MRPLMLALLAALLFGASTPASKVLLGELSPFQLAGLLYLGAALGTAPSAWKVRRAKRGSRIDSKSRWRLAGAVFFGGVVGPVLVLLALRSSTSASIALLLNLEIAATAVLGVLFFREHIGRWGWAGIAIGFLAGVLLSSAGGVTGMWAGVLVAAACAAWGIDNHLTALIDGLIPAEATAWKGLVAGATNVTIGLALEPLGGSELHVLLALGLGALSYGASIVLYVLSAQQLGATRAQVAFSSAPFLGAALSFVLLGEPLLWRHVAAAPLLLVGIAILFFDRHEHEHTHEALEHVHDHTHDDGHHDHAHPGLPPSTRHTHAHRHVGVTHGHRHLSDLHHRHPH